MQQADRALSAPVTPASGVKSPDTTDFTRRALFGAGAAIVATAAIAAPAPALAAPVGVDWTACRAAYGRARAAAARHLSQIYTPAWSRIVAAAGEMSPLSFTVTARSGHSWTYRMTPRDMDDYADSPIYARDAAPLRDAWRAWQDRRDRAQKAEGWAAIEARQEALDAAETKALDKLIETPAPTLSAAVEKVKLIRSEGYAGDALALIEADFDAVFVTFQQQKSWGKRGQKVNAGGRVKWKMAQSFVSAASPPRTAEA